MYPGVVQGFRLSPQQRRLWALERADPGWPCRTQALFEVAGDLDPQRLLAAVRRAVERHEILRTRFEVVAGSELPLQVIDERPELRFHEVELASAGPACGSAELDGIFARALAEPGHPGAGAPLAVYLIRSPQGDAFLLLSLPSLCADGRSLHNLAGEILGREAGDEPVQYADVAEVFLQLLESSETEAGRVYWTRGGADPAPARLPQQRAEPEARGGAVIGAVVGEASWQAQKGLAERLEGLARGLGTAVADVLAAGWLALLYRLTGSPDLRLGVCCDGRGHEGLDAAQGLFARYLPLRLPLEDDLGFAALCGQVRDATGEMRRWQDYHPADDTLPFGFDFTPRIELGGEGPKLALRREHAAVDRFQLRLSCQRSAEGLVFHLVYDARLYPSALVLALAHRLETLLAGCLGDTDTALGALDLLSPTERHHLLVEANDTRIDWQVRCCAHLLFEEQAACAPGAVAVEHGGAGLTYGELDARANRLARHLARQGVGRGTLVALSLARGVEMLVALLGILKAGGAYVPVDSTYPVERRRFLLDDAGVAVLVTDRRSASGLDLPGLAVVDLDRDAAEIAAESPRRMACAAGPDDLAYVIYTSGSTGRPKGVMIPHAGLVSYLRWCRQAYGVGPGATVPVHSPLGFDLTVTSLLAPLASGGTVVMVAAGPGVESLAETLSSRRDWSLVKITPAHLEALGQLLDEEAALRVDRLVVGGEALRGESLDLWTRKIPEARVVNEYGPTETVVGCCTCELSAGHAVAGAVPIGRPIANARIYLLDDRMQPVPVGVPGEIFIGGAGMARGYLGRPELTAERFVPDPYGALWGEPGARLYRSGDLACWRPDGELEFVGRVDHQVKVRGFRIEPGEIEAVLGQHPAVREAVVVAREEAPGERRLVAYVVPGGPRAPSFEELRSFLAERLPDYMVPAAFVELAALPLTANGKVDRQRLPARRQGRRLGRGDGEPFAAPRTPIEKTLAAIWSEVLREKKVGIHDNFFKLGGDSILSIRIVSRARRAGLVLLPRQLFQYPTIAQLAAVATPLAGQEATSAAAVAPFSLSGLDAGTLETLCGAPGEIEDAYPLSPTQQGMLFFYLYAPGSIAYLVQNSWTFQGDIDLAAFRRAWQTLVDRHAILRTSFLWYGVPAPLQVVHRRAELPWREHDWRGLDAGERQARLAALPAVERAGGFDLSMAPAMRFCVARLTDDAYGFCWSFHHILLDGWCIAVLTREMMLLYEAYRRGQEPRLDPPVPYRDYIAWLARQDATELEAFWRRYLAGLPGATRLALDRAPGRPATGGENVRSLWTRLPIAESTGLREAAQRLQVTLNILLQGALALMLGRYSGEDDVLFGTTVSGRPPELAGVESILGPLLNTLPVRVRLPARATLGSWLEDFQASYLELQPYEHSAQADVQRWSSVPGGESLFDCLLIFENLPPDAGVSPWVRSLKISDRQGFGRVSHPFTVVAAASPALLLGVGYDRNRFDDLDAKRMLSALLTLLLEMAGDPGRPLAALSSATPAERHQLLCEWSGAGGPSLAACRSVCQAFAEQVERAPGAVAVMAGGESWSYCELDLRASRLASVLRARGAGPETLVAICVERSCEMIMALLGVFKAGAAYLPLDPGYPPERLSFLLRDSGARLLLTRPHVAALLPEVRIPVIDLHAVPAPEAGWEPAGPAPEDLAYAIYTSGSTGTPKAVLIRHASLAAFTTAAAETYAIGPGDRVLQFASISFDASVEEIFPCLTRGATLVLRGEGMLDSIPAFLKECGRRGITVLDLPTAFWHELVPALEAGEELPPSVRLVIIGGEPALAERLARWRGRVGAGTRLVNTYGPTEGTVVATLSHLPERWQDAVPVGRPLAGVRTYVLDQALEPVPAGVPGELYLGGDGVARGYLDRPDATAGRFVPDPFAAEPGARLFRTGDRARHLATGELEFVGRTDHQVKVRGFRIEPGEVEAVLRAHPAVRQAAVVAREPEPGGRRLVAYVVTEPAAATGAAELRELLQRRLPGYMVPSAFVRLPALPLTAGGKLDRRALPDPAGEEGESAPAAPSTPAEEVMLGIWAEVLGSRRIGLHDDFFALGGHSLLAMRTMSRVRSVFGVELPLRELFEMPTVAQLAERVEAAKRAGESPAAPPLVPVSRERGLPLSFAQQRLWFLDQLEPGSPAYNIAMAARVPGDLDLPALEWSLTEIVRRHQVLRTVFAPAGGEPVQVVLPPAPVRVPLVDLGGLCAADRQRAGRALVRAEALHPFDLARGPLLRVTLLHLGTEEPVVLTTMHHIVADGWSLGILRTEIGALYKAYRSGRPSPLPELLVQYADFAVWQRGWLQGEALEQELAYWRGRLTGAPALLALPTDRPRPAVQSQRGALHHSSLPPQLGVALRQLGQRLGATLFMTVLAAFQALLGRHTGQDDLSVGTPVSGRDRLELEGLIGFFVNTLVLRVDLSGEPSFAGLLGRVRETVLEAHRHQQLPFEKLVEELAPQRSLAHSPLFQVLFALQDGGRTEGPRALAPREDLEAGGATAKFDLTLAVGAGSGAFTVAVEYSTDLFDGATVARLARQLVRLLEGVAGDPGSPLADLPLLAEPELHELLVAWNDTGAGNVAEPCLHRLFAAQARRAPEAVALVWGGEALSYGELDRRANGLAHALVRLGVGPEVLVGVCLERSPELVVALVAVLKAGGAYLPLDPRYPAERLRFLLEDAGAQVAVTRERLLDVSPAQSVRTLCLDRDAELLAAQPESAPAVAVDGDNLAYVIYTSGSTGRAKGVAIAHRSAAALVAWAVETYSPEELSGVLGSTSMSFDLSVFEWFVPLSAGGRVVLARDALQVEDWQGQGVRLVNTVPSVMAELLRLGALPPSVCTVNLAGEALARDLVEHLHGAGVERVYNLYGPTEDTTYSTLARLEPGETGPPPIGRPLGGGRAHVLDGSLAPVPVGVVGEVYLGGAGLARGYLRRPALTAERFVPDPFGSLRGEPGARLYRTGDLARYRGDGSLEFLGRIDHQVKVRGFRIEPGEVEAALRACPGIREAVVVAREDAPGDKRLVAYVVARPGEAPLAARLRGHLRETLPEHMVPSTFLLLSALPLTPNGKVDRRALPAPEPGGARGGGSAAPRGPVEELVAEIWVQVLGAGQVGAGEDFFALGGHSLLAVRMMSRVRAVLGVELPLRSVFEAPTVAGLAQRIEAARRAGEAPVAPPIVPVPRAGRLPLSFAQQRLWFLDQLEPGSPMYNIALATRVTGELDLPALELGLSEMVRRHEALRTVFESVDGEPAQVIVPAAPVRLPRVDLNALPESLRIAESRRLTGAEARQPFDLSRGPLLRASLLRLAAGDHVLLTTMHHIVSDGWSVEIFRAELATLYEAFRSVLPSPLPELPVQYVDFAAWQRRWLQGEALAREVAYWRQRLAGAPEVLDLPADRPRPVVRSSRGSSLGFSVPEPVVAALRQMGSSQSVTLFMILLTAFQVLLSRWTGQADVSVGTPEAGRNRLELEELIGFFVNTLVLRLDLSGDPSFVALLGRVREAVLEAHAHQDLPFEKLVEELAPQRSLSHSPLFQAMFLLQPRPLRPRPQAGLSGEPFGGSQSGTAKLELMLALGETESGLAGAIEYSTDLFDAATIQRMARQLVHLLSGLASDPGSPLAELLALSSPEPAQLLRGGFRIEPAPKRLEDVPPGRALAPRDDLELELSQIWEDVLNVRPIGVRDDFFSLGGHSLLAVRLMARIRRRFGCDLPLATLFEAATIEHLGARLRQKGSGAGRSPLVRLQTGGLKPPLFCVHPVGGNVLCYLDLARSLGTDQPFYGLQASPPTGDGGQASDIEDMAAHYLAAVREVQPRGPYLLAGWSMGGLVAFEMARQLAGQGEAVDLVALVDVAAPNGRQGGQVDPASLARAFARDWGGLSASRLEGAARGETEDEILSSLLAQGRREDAIPADLGLPELARLFSTFRANYRAMCGYAGGAYAGPITLFTATGRAGEGMDAALGWRSLAAGGVEVHPVSGDHYSLLRKPHVQALAERLRACIESCLARG